MTKLVVIASNPPTTAGTRTRARADLAREVLGFEHVELVNLFPLASYRTGEIAQLGQEPEPWLEGRSALEQSLSQATAALLAYGVAEPPGPARIHFRAQVEWLDSRRGVEGGVGNSRGPGLTAG